MIPLKGKRIFITGASRGIGREIALRCAKESAKIAIAAKTDQPHPTLEGTIHSVAEEIERAGGTAMPIHLDVRDEKAIDDAFEKVVSTWGGLDILINNASAIFLAPTTETPIKRYDLIQSVNARATFVCSQAAIPHLKKADNPHILNLSPPLNMNPKWFKDHLAYTISKYGMSMCTLGMAEELKSFGIAVNSLWPKTTIATAAIAVNFPKAILQASRKPSIMADATFEIITSNSKDTTGNFFIDEEVLAAKGIKNFDQYAINKDIPLFADLFLN